MAVLIDRLCVEFKIVFKMIMQTLISPVHESKTFLDHSGDLLLSIGICRVQRPLTSPSQIWANLYQILFVVPEG